VKVKKRHSYLTVIEVRAKQSLTWGWGELYIGRGMRGLCGVKMFCILIGVVTSRVDTPAKAIS
jgi:TM2 domain-containing membrane protein YozV